MFLEEKLSPQKAGSTELSIIPWRQLLLDAADLLEKRGWCQKRYRTRDGFCAAGAIDYCIRFYGYPDHVVRMTFSRLNEALNIRYPKLSQMFFVTLLKGIESSGALIVYNDRPRCTKQEIIDLLRGCANGRILL